MPIYKTQTLIHYFLVCSFPYWRQNCISRPKGGPKIQDLINILPPQICIQTFCFFLKGKKKEWNGEMLASLCLFLKNRCSCIGILFCFALFLTRLNEPKLFPLLAQETERTVKLLSFFTTPQKGHPRMMALLALLGREKKLEGCTNQLMSIWTDHPIITIPNREKSFRCWNEFLKLASGLVCFNTEKMCNLLQIWKNLKFLLLQCWFFIPGLFAVWWRCYSFSHVQLLAIFMGHLLTFH